MIDNWCLRAYKLYAIEMKDSIKTQSTYLRYKEEKCLASKDSSNTFFPFLQDTSKVRVYFDLAAFYLCC